MDPSWPSAEELLTHKTCLSPMVMSICEVMDITLVLMLTS